MKPRTERCIRYCDLFEGCTLTECDRKAILYPKGIKMVEPKEWNRWRKSEIKSAYRELALTKKENKIFIK